MKSKSRPGNLAIAVALGIAIVAGSLASPITATALSGSDFQAGLIISDAVFSDSTTLSQSDIQNFLQTAGANCQAVNGVPCLKDYTATTYDRAASANHCSAYAGAANELASSIIAKVSVACGINPQVMIVLLEKEQGLVSSSGPSSSRYQIATGYGCPDTSACDAQYYGFYNQVYKAAWQLKEYSVDPGYWRYHVGNVSIQYNPNANCGSSVVNIQSAGTAALYNYTPYQPNTAALSNLNSTGDTCSSYGNRNFWVYFSNWFGPPTGSRSPVGFVDALAATPGAMSVRGWALDPDTVNPIRIDVYSDGVGVATFTANTSRPDIGAAYPDYGANHGYDTSVPLAVGTHNVCVYGINVGVGSNILLGCSTINVPTASPIGGADFAAAPGQIVARGWTIDPNTQNPISVQTSIDGAASTTFVANDNRPDVGAAYSGYGNNHGIAQTFAVAPGTHSICMSAMNVGLGSNTSLGCGTVVVQSGSPFGAVDGISSTPGSATLRGWAIDPDTAGAVRVDVYSDGVGVATFSANSPRADVAAVYPGYGANHGYDATISLATGTHNVCAYGINVGPGSNILIKCSTVTVPSASPFGGANFIVHPGKVDIRGWTIDPNTTSPINIQAFVDGSSVGTFVASDNRPDVGAAYPGSGNNHGISQTINVGPGAHSICVYGINVGPGANTSLTCGNVVIPSGSPNGALDGVTGQPGAMVLRGWALDPDTADPIRVDVYSDGVGVASFTANSSRPDVGNAYPVYGASHGYNVTVPTAAGTHNVCAYGINVGVGTNALLGCRSVAVPSAG